MTTELEEAKAWAEDAIRQGSECAPAPVGGGHLRSFRFSQGQPKGLLMTQTPETVETILIELAQAICRETRSPQGIAAIVPLLASAPADPGARAIYLHEIQDPGNLGTILRTLAS